MHSCVLGTLLLLAPRFMLWLFGFPETASLFFPSQSGIFLLILGVCYLVGLYDPGLVKVIVISKTFAVVFLAVHAAFLSAPRSIWAAAAGDATMLAALTAALLRRRRLALVLTNTLVNSEETLLPPRR
jgi:hypothetical protein